MTVKISPVLDAQELRAIIADPRLILVDARQGKDAYEQYLKSHLVGAQHIDLETQLSAPDDAARGGRHPLPELMDFARTLGKMGISPSARVVIYDNTSGAIAAARFWWMLRAVGHSEVQVLDGGWQKALEAGIPLESGEVTPVIVENYPVDAWRFGLSEIDEVKDISRSGIGCVIDVREEFRYEGKSEPIDPVAGHIPGAENIFFKRNLDHHGCFLSSGQLRELYSPLLQQAQGANLVVHCGSGVTACHTILAMDIAGLPLPRLYVGSWSEWCRNDLPVAITH